METPPRTAGAVCLVAWLRGTLSLPVPDLLAHVPLRPPPQVGWFDLESNSSGVLTSRLASDASYVRGAVGDTLSLMLQVGTGNRGVGAHTGVGLRWLFPSIT